MYTAVFEHFSYEPFPRCMQVHRGAGRKGRKLCKRSDNVQQVFRNPSQRTRFELLFRPGSSLQKTLAGSDRLGDCHPALGAVTIKLSATATE